MHWPLSCSQPTQTWKRPPIPNIINPFLPSSPSVCHTTRSSHQRTQTPLPTHNPSQHAFLFNPHPFLLFDSEHGSPPPPSIWEWEYVTTASTNIPSHWVCAVRSFSANVQIQNLLVILHITAFPHPATFSIVQSTISKTRHWPLTDQF